MSPAQPGSRCDCPAEMQRSRLRRRVVEEYGEGRLVGERFWQLTWDLLEALTSVLVSDVGLGLSTMVEKGVCSSSSALLILEDLIPGVNMEVNMVTSIWRLLLSLGCSSSCLLSNASIF